jgi:hypothetical protein
MNRSQEQILAAKSDARLTELTVWGHAILPSTWLHRPQMTF